MKPIAVIFTLSFSKSVLSRPYELGKNTFSYFVGVNTQATSKVAIPYQKKYPFSAKVIQPAFINPQSRIADYHRYPKFK